GRTAGPPCAASGRNPWSLCTPRMLRRPADRADDVLVAGAPADLAGQDLADLGLGRVRVAVEQPARGHHHARRAEAALQAVAFDEPLLDRVELAVFGEVLDGTDRTPVGHRREHRARLDRRLVEPHDAGAAVG